MAIPLKGLSDKLKAFLTAQSWRCDATGPGTAQLVMLRGCKVNADGSLSAYGDPQVYTDHYDDVLVVFGLKSKGQPYLQTFRASAKPGLAWIHHRSYANAAQGCPTVQPGQYRYQRGDHKGHDALRQCANSPVVVIRDLDDDARLEVTDLVDYPMYTGINIHAGGTSGRVGLNSSGCQVLWGGWDGKPWADFYWLTYAVAEKQSVFHYTLADFAMFAEWHDAPAPKPRHLLFGSAGNSVVKQQKALAGSGYFPSAACDGVFGRATDRAVRICQKKQKIPETGILHL